MNMLCDFYQILAQIPVRAMTSLDLRAKKSHATHAFRLR